MSRLSSHLRRWLTVVTLCSISSVLHATGRWVDVTSFFLNNPEFTTGSTSDWTITGKASSLGAVSYSCMEMWNGYMRIEHRQTGVPNGHYRLSMQGFYRTREHNEAYRRYTNGTEVISAHLFANGQEKTLPSEYIFHFDSNVGRTYTPDGTIYFANSMETAHKAFELGEYWNELEFDVTDGTVSFGVYNEEDRARNDNWLIFDSFRLEQYMETYMPSVGSICLNEVMAANVDVMMSPAYNFDGWIELYNTTAQPVTLGGCYLSDDPSEPRKWHLPMAYGNLDAYGRCQIWMGSHEIRAMQAPFKLDCEGGFLILTTEDGQQVMNESYPPAISRAAYARTTDGGDEWAWTDRPTPGTDNSRTTYADGRVEPPVINQPGGFFEQNFKLYPTRPTGTILRYTTDGTTPTLTNGHTQDSQGISVNNSQTLRFRLFQDGMLPSEVVTRTFIKKDHDHTLPVIMVSATPRYLYDDSIGVYVRGVNGRTGNGQSSPANWNMDWDRPVNFHYVLPQTNEVVVNQDVDFTISGGWTRSNNPKSFKLKADRVYEGLNTIDYPFFSAKPFNRNKTLQVRYGGNDNHHRIKDAALHEIIQRSGIDLDVMSYQPAVHYINGEYKGLINIREPNNKDFAFANWGLGKDELEVYEQSPDSGAYMMLGSRDVLDRLVELSQTASRPESYEEIRSLLDIDEYINYMAAELYLSSWDWPDNNVKAYRPKDGGRYRFTFFDLDAAFGTEGRQYDEENEVLMDGNPLRWIEGMQWHRYDYIYDTGERRYGEIRFCTFFLNMLSNTTFRRQFIDALSIMAGSIFDPFRIEDILNELGDRVRPTMAWENASPDGSLNEIRNAMNGRADRWAKYMKDYAPLRLGSATTCQLSLDSNVPDAPIFLNGQLVPYGQFSGPVFAPATLSVQVPAGYRFLGWGPSKSPGWYYSHNTQYQITDRQSSYTLVACFEPISHSDGSPSESPAPLVINEVSPANDIYVNEYFKRNDWVELYNTTQDTIDVAGYYLSDDAAKPDKYRISSGDSQASTLIPPHGHLIIWCDKAAPQSQLHASFKLDADGGIVSIAAPDLSWSNALSYSTVTGTQTVGRYPDGAEQVFLMNVPTIGRRNLHTSYLTTVDQSDVNGIVLLSQENQDGGLSLRYAAGHLIVSQAPSPSSHPSSLITLTIYTLSGQQLSAANMRMNGGRAEADCHHLPTGCYVARATDEQGHTATLKFVVTNP